MKKIGLRQCRRNEKAIIDALLKISEIVQKTEANQQYQKSINTNKPVAEDDFNAFYNDNEQQQVPIPPPMRTLDSYVSGFNQQSLQKPSNCNQASTHRPKQYPSSLPRNPSKDSKSNNHDYQDQIHSYKRRYYDTSSISSLSNDHHRKKCSRHSSFRSNKNSQPMRQETEKIEHQPTNTTLNSQTTSYQINSAATTTLDDQSPSLIMMPAVSVPTILPSSPPPMTIDQQSSINPAPLHNEKQQAQFSSSSKTDFDHFIDQQLQATLEKCLRNHLSSSAKMMNENIQQRKTRLSILTESETKKLIDELDYTKQSYDLEHYEKQRELAMLAAKQGNYPLSYSIYTNLLHDSQYDYKFKSEILSSRATILLLEEKCFESIDDCTQAIAFNQWNKLAYVIRAACWMIKQEYFKAVDDYSKLFHFFDQSQHVLDLLNLAYEKFQSSNQNIDDEQKKENNIPQSLDTHVHPFQPAVYLCYP